MSDNQIQPPVEPQPPILPPAFYRVWAWLVGTVLPALGTAIGVLGPLWGMQTDKWQTTIQVIALTLGTIFNIRVHQASKQS